MKRALLAAAAAAACLVVLTGCAGGISGQSADNVKEVTVTLQDGRTVQCLLWDGGSYDGGMSCDWDSSKG